MLKDREKLYQAYHTILSMALSWAFTLILNQNYELRVPMVLCAVFSFLPALAIYLFDLNKKNAITYILVGSIIPILALVFWILKINPLIWLSDLSSFINRYDGSEALYVAHHANVVVLCIGLISSLLFYLIMKRQLTKLILAIAIFVTLIILSVKQVDINKVVVGISIFYMMSILIEQYGVFYSQRTGKPVKREGILYLAPVCLLLALGASVLPSKPQPIEWTAIKNMYYNVSDQIEQARINLNYYFGNVNTEFFVGLSGYSEDAELGNGADLLQDKKIALQFSATENDRSIYMIGSVSDTYTGHSWEKSRQDFLPEQEEYVLDYTELIYALSRQNQELLENNRMLERVVFKAKYNHIKTKTFFYPLKTSAYQMLSKRQDLLTNPSGILFEKVQGKGTSYECFFYEMNLQGNAFIQMLREADDFSYDNAPLPDQKSLKYLDLNIINNDNIDDPLEKQDILRQLGERAKLIKQQYTTLPEELPDRVKILAEEITSDYDTDYDKLKAIEAYLQSYRYSLEGQKLPNGQDFVDYFLFDSKSGYCTSYATAMAVLGRCIGIPTRYVEGFIGKFEYKDDDNLYPVRNSQAHAWAEAYIEGVGWIPFEATAPFYTTRYTKWAELQKKGDQDEAVANPYEFYRHDMENITPSITPEQSKAKQSASNWIKGGIILFVAVLLLLIAFITYYMILSYRYKKRYEKADDSKKMYLLLLRILRLLKKEGFELDQLETILMLAQRVKDRFHYDRVTFHEVAQIYMKYRYAEEAVTKDDLAKVETYHKGLSMKRREDNNKWKLWMEEYLFLMRNRNA